MKQEGKITYWFMLKSFMFQFSQDPLMLEGMLSGINLNNAIAWAQKHEVPLGNET